MFSSINIGCLGMSKESKDLRIVVSMMHSRMGWTPMGGQGPAFWASDVRPTRTVSNRQKGDPCHGCHGPSRGVKLFSQQLPTLHTRIQNHLSYTP